MTGKKKYVRIRSVDVGRVGHHYLKIGITKKTGVRGGHTHVIGGLRKYKHSVKRMVKEI